MSEPLDPASPDAPISHLLSLRHNPCVADMTPDQLRELITKIRETRTSAPTLSAKILSESDTIKPRAKKLTPEQQARKNALDLL